MLIKYGTMKSTLVLDAVPGVTRYVQLANFVRQKIVSREWPVGMVLPTVQDLSGELGIARVTVRQAYSILVREKLIISERGRGSRVTGLPRPPAEGLRAAVNSWLDVPDGFRIRILKKEEVSELPGELRLAGKAAPRYVHLQKLHLHHDQIICVADFYVASDIFGRLPRGSEKNNKVTSLMAQYAKEQMELSHQVITVSQADADLARMLQCNFAAPVAKVTRDITNSAGLIVYASKTDYRADHFIFDMTLPVEVIYGRHKLASITAPEPRTKVPSMKKSRNGRARKSAPAAAVRNWVEGAKK